MLNIDLLVSSQLPTNGTPKKIVLNPTAFSDKARHEDILNRLLNDVKPVNFRELVALDEDDKKLSQKHFVYGVVKEILDIAAARKWNLCQSNFYVYVFNGCYWKTLSKDELKGFLSHAAVKMGVPECEAKHFEFTDRLFKQFMSVAALPQKESDTKKTLINILDGTFEFTSDGWNLRDHSHDDFLTYQLGFSFNAESECPLFMKYLNRVLPDEGSRNILQEFAGYIFTSLKLEKCLVLYGNGANGKSVFMTVLCALLGDENVLNFNLGSFSQEYNRAKLVNVLLNYSSEKGFDLAPDTFKTLISGEPIQARVIYQQPFNLYNRARFVTNANELPRETEHTQAYFRRFLIIPFLETIPESEQDIELPNKILENELPGVFNWMLTGLERIMQQKKFSKCEAADKALNDFRKQSDSVGLFIDENEYKPAEHNRESLTDLYSSYKGFCADDGYKPLGKNRFSGRLEKSGFEKIRTSGGNYFKIERKTELL